MRPANNVRRPRGRPNRKQHGSPRSQTYDSHGPDVRVRGNATQIYDKYLSLARDAAASGDRVAAEGYFQFAEHYFRIINDSTDPRRANPQQQGRGEHGQNGADQQRADQQRAERDQGRGPQGQQPVPSEQPPLEMEQPFIDQNQAQGMWPPQVDGAPEAAPAGGDGSGRRRRAADGEAKADGADESGNGTGGEAAKADGSEEDAPPRRAARGRPRGRRKANGAAKSDEDTAPEEKDGGSPASDAESEGLST